DVFGISKCLTDRPVAPGQGANEVTCTIRPDVSIGDKLESISGRNQGQTEAPKLKQGLVNGVIIDDRYCRGRGSEAARVVNADDPDRTIPHRITCHHIYVKAPFSSRPISPI